jgi:DNA repair protein RecO (recombination protein O)
MSQIKTSALVLKSINWKDSSKIVALYTRDKGRVDVLAKGVKRKNHPQSANFEALNHIETIIYFSEKRELQNIGESTLLNSFHKIRNDLEKTAIGLAILELIDIFFQQSETDTIFFDFLLTQFKALDQSANFQVVFWYFILKLLSYLGFKPQFANCNSCGKDKNEDAYFQKTSGSVFCKNCIGETLLFVKLKKDFHKFLILLQNTNHKKIASVEFPQKLNFNNFTFLLDYLRYHTEQNVELNSLKMIL